MSRKANSYGLLSIRNRILIFSFLVTVLPSLSTGLLLYNMMQSTLQKKVEQKFVDSADIFKKELSLWFKERVYDLNVFSNSTIISDGIAEFTTQSSNENKESTQTYQLQTLETYLTTLQNQFENYARILILTKSGIPIAPPLSKNQESNLLYPENAITQITDKRWFKGDVYFHNGSGEPLMLIGIPLFTDSLYNYEAVLALEIRLKGLSPLLKDVQPGNDDRELYKSLVSLSNNHHFLNSKGDTSSADTSLPIPQFATANDNNQFQIQEFVIGKDQHLMGMLIPFKKLGWGLFIAKDYEQVFSEAIRSRNQNFIIVITLSMFIGVAAFFLTRQITRPLSILTAGAQKVANGDLDVRLEVKRNDEIGFATSVFNEMVAKLKATQVELEQLATTDPLTGLSNRKQIMTSLNNLFEYHQRYKTQFSVLMLDVDHFKAVNDTHGHQAGDAVLKQIALIFHDNLRNVDFAGRYGGEEFLVILPESSEYETLQVANRIRLAVANHIFRFEDIEMQLHISIGVSRVKEKETDIESIIKRADKALYAAKSRGRNQVVIFTAENNVQPETAAEVISLSQ